MKRMLVLLTALLLAVLPAITPSAAEEDLSIWDIVDGSSEEHILPEPTEAPDADTAEPALPEGLPGAIDMDAEPAETDAPAVNAAREDFIDRIVALGQELYIKADGRSQRAHYSGDIYVCKNFTTYLFRENRADFCMAEFPDVQLKIPNNLPKAECRPYSYGLAWEDVAPEDGNPFYAAAEFRYDKSLSAEENFVKACEFMRQAQRGDFFQMSADYEYGVGAHSAIMLGYDPETDEIHWMDSNMRGGKRNGIRYGMVQFDEVRSVEWWAGTFCHKTRGATLYRLRDDIAYREESGN